MSQTAGTTREFVTFHLGGRLLGAAVEDVHDVFRIHALTPVPLARPDVAGLLNLRGRIITAIDARIRLGLPPRENSYLGAMAIGVTRHAEHYGPVVDSVGDVLRLSPESLQPPPPSLDATWRAVTLGVCKLPDTLMIALDIDRVLDVPARAAAA
jgi:purine-binding chemotaxis protein CheW